MNTQILTWAARHNVTLEALAELQNIFCINGGHSMPEKVTGVSENAVQSLVRLEGSRKGILLFRNNVGVLKDETGRPVRYGLANDSAQVNRVIKSGDLIGGRPVKIEPHHVGSVILQFVSRECKRPGWHYTATAHEVAQLNWAQLIVANGGDASFCTGEGSL